MHRFLKSFERTLFLLMRIILIVLMFTTFFVFYRPYSLEFQRGINRVSVIVTSVFLIFFYIMIRLYGGFSIGRKRTKEIIISIMLSVLFTDCFAFMAFCIMEKKVQPIFTLIFILLVQIIIIIFYTKFINNLYYYMNPSQKLLIIYNEKSKLNLLLEKLKMYQNMFSVDKIMHSHDEGIHRSIRASNAVMLVGLLADEKEYITEYCYKRSKQIYTLPEVSDILMNSCEHMLIDDISVFAHEKSTLSIEQRVLKRFTDLLISLIATIILSPVMVLEALAIKLEDKGPVFYKQERCTIRGKIFEVIKFRTMVVDAEKNGAVLASKNDCRITKVGNFLRKTRLDELPQLFNIIKGDMSIVGPRPERKVIATYYEKDLPEFSYRLRVKAGLTGLAQIMGKYNTTPKDKLMLDLIYIEKYSLVLDFKIMLQTLVVCLTPEKTEGIKEKSKTYKIKTQKKDIS